MDTSLKLKSLTGLFIFILNAGYSQVGTGNGVCGSEIPSPAWNTEFQKLVEQRQASQAANKTQQTVYTIPVIIHVIHGGQPVGTFPNLAQGQLNSQILVLNNDYAGLGYNSGNYPVSAYSNWAIANSIPAANLDASGRIKIADCSVEFCLATRDTLGNTLPEPGIDRINYVTQGWASPTSYTSITSFQNFINNTVKPQTIWNVSEYLNIWLTDEDLNATGGLLGYSTFPAFAGLLGLPGAGTNSSDGIWCYSMAFGSSATFPTGNYYPGYDHGRTSTHEIGHYLGLRHIWGDGTCITDYCNDTPPGSSSNFGSPTYPFKTTACTGNSPDGEMFMNFMDYTVDAAKYMFTTDQAARIQTSMTNSPYRKFLGTHNLCNVSGVPAVAFFNTSFIACTGATVGLANTSTGFPPPTYTWSSTGGSLDSSVNVLSPTITFSTPGVYVVTLAADNGTLSTYSKTITVKSPPISLVASSQAICAGNSVDLSASGLNTYTWEPGGIVYDSVTYSPTQPQTYTCSATDVDGCQTTATISVFVSECTGIPTFVAQSSQLKVYPNPANELLNISWDADKNTRAKVEITDALGKIALCQDLLFVKEKQEYSLTISSLSKGVYFIKLRSDQAISPCIKFVKE